MSFTATTTTATTVFWPLEQNDDNDGSPYGWHTPGKICVAGVHSDKSQARQRLRRSPNAPTLLDHLDLSTLPRIYYHRYPSQSLRFYQLDETLNRKSEGIDYTLIHQFNQAHQVWSIVNDKPIRLHRPTAGFLLNVAAHVIRPIVALYRYGHVPFLTPLLPHSALAQQLKVRGRQAETFLLNVDALSKAKDETYIPEYAQLYTRYVSSSSAWNTSDLSQILQRYLAHSERLHSWLLLRHPFMRQRYASFRTAIRKDRGTPYQLHALVPILIHHSFTVSIKSKRALSGSTHGRRV
jgi:hypothetical protein